MEKGFIFDIIRNSFVDGPGIRTTVFFKGCNLKCVWCHNPESQSFEAQLMFYKNKCTGCGECLKVCPHHLKSCELCGKCTLYCPNGARKISGKEMSADEVIEEIRKDKIFYDTSNGGVTFSGGECMLQLDFLKEMLKKCKEYHIHTAVDTAGNVPWESFEQILPYTDLFLYDVKLMDSQQHKKYTGVGNERILENLKRLSAAGKDIIIRVPVIAGVNDTDEEMQKISDFVKSLHIRKTELLPYHSMGEHKYDALNRVCEKFTAPTDERMREWENFMIITPEIR